jgi:hypothetical protein
MTLYGTTCSVKSEGAKTTLTGHTNMSLGFSEPDIRGELQFGNNMLYQ